MEGHKEYNLQVFIQDIYGGRIPSLFGICIGTWYFLLPVLTFAYGGLLFVSSQFSFAIGGALHTVRGRLLFRYVDNKSDGNKT